MKIRQVITGTDQEGISRVFFDGTARRNVILDSMPGFASALLGTTASMPAIGRGEPADTTVHATYLPSLGETRLLVVTMPPDTVMMRADFDAMAFGAEFGQKLPDFAATFDPASPGMHTTDTIDYAVVLEGEIVLELDNAQRIPLRRNEIAVQNGNRHAWRNPGDVTAVMLFVLIGARRT